MSVVANRGVESAQTGTPACPADPDCVTDQAWPLALDLGADQLHNQGITGNGVTVAVIDSGVAFDPKVRFSSNGNDKNHLAMPDAIRFAGQADFTTCSGNHCYLPDHWNAMDPFGHGSHVASSIGSRFQDQATGTYLGVAPDADILSIRVLDDARALGPMLRSLKAFNLP